MLAVLQAISLVVYIFIARRFQYKNVGHAAAATAAAAGAAPHPAAQAVPCRHVTPIATTFYALTTPNPLPPCAAG